MTNQVAHMIKSTQTNWFARFAYPVTETIIFCVEHAYIVQFRILSDMFVLNYASISEVAAIHT